ncbi:carbohydrate ABC transporter permease [Jiangella muralis]|uniref:carbohydrate ABC transporter permease n=1 Tax=Jiangella muralis TaxID=702383 RepID=UPI00146FCB55|nr:sugar ABC transporter permease [Jiangella muralis]
MRAAGSGPPRRRRVWGYVTPLLLLAPSLIFYGVFVLQPLVKSVELSFTDWDGAAPTLNYVGLDNYAQLIGDDRFLLALGRTVIWSALYIALAVGGGLLFAALITELRRGQALVRALAFLPHALALAVTGVIWAQLFHPNIGAINAGLEAMHLGGLAQAWLGEPLLALPSVAVSSGWHAYGFYMVIFLASMQTIDPQLYEAAAIDGAGGWHRFRHVTLPGLHNATTVVLTLATINSLKGFDAVWAMTGGGPAYATEIVAVYIWRVAFQVGELGLAAAASVILTIIVLAFTIGFNRNRDRRAV